MLFNSMVFIFVFLPLVWTIDRILLHLPDQSYAKIFLVAASFVFYGYYNPKYMLLLGCSIIINYLISLCFEKAQANCRIRKLILVVALTLNLGALFYFKYFNFFIDNCNVLLHTNIEIEKIALPLGISFFTFQQISFVVDRYWKKAKHYAFWDYATFVSFFPQLVAGPIVLHADFIPQLQTRSKKIDSEKLFEGIALFILGLAKKVLLADTLARMVNPAFEDWIIRTYYIDIPTGWMIAFFFMFELYFDFSGYSDMARGLGRMFGIELPINFDSPLKSESISEFWNRWHMTLNQWLTQYIYIPLGGNRKGKIRTYINILTVFLVSGLWHGANWTFVLWGLLQGIAVSEERIVKKRWPFKWMRILFTNIYVTLTVVIFKSESLSAAWIYLKRSFTIKPGVYFMRVGRNLEMAETYLGSKLIQMKCPKLLDSYYMLWMLFVAAISIYFLSGPNANERVSDGKWTTARIVRLGLLLVWIIISLSSVSTFLYFNF